MLNLWKSSILGLSPTDEVACTLGTGAFGNVVECIDKDKYLKLGAWRRTSEALGGSVV